MHVESQVPGETQEKLRYCINFSLFIGTPSKPDSELLHQVPDCTLESRAGTQEFQYMCMYF